MQILPVRTWSLQLLALEINIRILTANANFNFKQTCEFVYNVGSIPTLPTLLLLQREVEMLA